MIDYYEIKSQPITRAMVWAAYKEVRSSLKSSGVDAMRWQWLEKSKSMLLPNIFISTKSETSILDKFQKMRIHKNRITIEQLASYLRPIARGLINN